MARSARRPGSQPQAGGNIGALVGDDGTFLIDDQYAPLTNKIQAPLDDVTDRPVKYVFNVRDRVRAMVEEGRSLDEVLSAAYDAEYGKGFIDPERFVTSIYRSLTTEKFPRRPVRGGLTRQESPGFSRGSVNAPARTAPSSAC